jgi:hypothetical protein
VRFSKEVKAWQNTPASKSAADLTQKIMCVIGSRRPPHAPGPYFVALIGVEMVKAFDCLPNGGFH